MADRGDAKFMQGFPPPRNMRVRFADGSFLRWPQLRWSLSHMEQLVPTRPVWRGPGAAGPLPLEDAGLARLELSLAGGSRASLSRVLQRCCTDGFGVLHRGELVCEIYDARGAPHRRHLVQSCAKSFAGLMAEMLIAEGCLDDDLPVTDILPELGESAWARATLRHVLDMQVAMDFAEDYTDPHAQIWDYLRAAGMVPTPPGAALEGVADYLPRIAPAGPHGQIFAYREPNINVLTWLLMRRTGEHLNKLFSRLIWQHIGAEHDAYYMVDPNGFCTSAGCTLRDFLRFGEALRTGLGGRIGPDVQGTVFAGGDRDSFAAAGLPTMPGWSYRSMFWVRHVAGRACPVARGAYGQLLYIDPENDLVIARLASARQPAGYFHDDLILPLIDQITAHLAG